MPSTLYTSSVSRVKQPFKFKTFHDCVFRTIITLVNREIIKQQEILSLTNLYSPAAIIAGSALHTFFNNNNNKDGIGSNGVVIIFHVIQSLL